MRWVCTIVVLAASACGDQAVEQGTPAPSSDVAPGVVHEQRCSGPELCGAGFELDGEHFSLSCRAIRAAAVTDEVIGEGRMNGRKVTVNVIADVDPDVLVAVSSPGGDCGEDDPDAQRSSWSMAIPSAGDPTKLSKAVCSVGALSAAERLADGCHLGGELLSCGSGPGFPPDVLDDLAAFPEPSDSFGADVEALLGAEPPGDLIGWHVIVEESAPDGGYVQLLLRTDPSSGELQFLLDGSDEVFDAPRACDIESAQRSS